MKKKMTLVSQLRTKAAVTIVAGLIHGALYFAAAEVARRAELKKQ